MNFRETIYTHSHMSTYYNCVPRACKRKKKVRGPNMYVCCYGHSLKRLSLRFLWVPLLNPIQLLSSEHRSLLGWTLQCTQPCNLTEKVAQNSSIVFFISWLHMKTCFIKFLKVPNRNILKTRPHYSSVLILGKNVLCHENSKANSIRGITLTAALEA